MSAYAALNMAPKGQSFVKGHPRLPRYRTGTEHIPTIRALGLVIGIDRRLPVFTILFTTVTSLRKVFRAVVSSWCPRNHDVAFGIVLCRHQTNAGTEDHVSLAGSNAYSLCSAHVPQRQAFRSSKGVFSCSLLGPAHLNKKRNCYCSHWRASTRETSYSYVADGLCTSRSVLRGQITDARIFGAV